MVEDAALALCLSRVRAKSHSSRTTLALSSSRERRSRSSMLSSLNAGTLECGRPQIVFERGRCKTVIEPKLCASQWVPGVCQEAARGFPCGLGNNRSRQAHRQHAPMQSTVASLSILLLHQRHINWEITLGPGTLLPGARFSDTSPFPKRIGGAKNEAPVPQRRRGFSLPRGVGFGQSTQQVYDAGHS